jgi:hypothetical protein
VEQQAVERLADRHLLPMDIRPVVLTLARHRHLSQTAMRMEARMATQRELLTATPMVILMAMLAGHHHSSNGAMDHKQAMLAAAMTNHPSITKRHHLHLPHHERNPTAHDPKPMVQNEHNLDHEHTAMRQPPGKRPKKSNGGEKMSGGKKKSKSEKMRRPRRRQQRRRKLRLKQSARPRLQRRSCDGRSSEHGRKKSESERRGKDLLGRGWRRRRQTPREYGWRRS